MIAYIIGWCSHTKQVQNLRDDVFVKFERNNEIIVLHALVYTEDSKQKWDTQCQIA